NRASVGAREGGFFARWILSTQSTATRDKYNVRLERGTAPGTTEIYLTHRAMEEVAPDASGAARAGWQVRPGDPELEAEMLHRLVAQLSDMRPVQTATNTAPQETSVSAPNARLSRSNNGVPLLTLEDSLDRAWRRVGLSLDRIGFTVEDRDRSKGIYYVRYIDPDTVGEKPGFLKRMFRSEVAPHNQFQVQVKPIESGSSVEVLDKDGAASASKTSERILSLLYEQLK
ncbi:MAG: outer membrane protein assembly factor BamC, partial [Sulfurifustis sp.]